MKPDSLKTSALKVSILQRGSHCSNRNCMPHTIQRKRRKQTRSSSLSLTCTHGHARNGSSIIMWTSNNVDKFRISFCCLRPYSHTHIHKFAWQTLQAGRCAEGNFLLSYRISPVPWAMPVLQHKSLLCRKKRGSKLPPP